MYFLKNVLNFLVAGVLLVGATKQVEAAEPMIQWSCSSPTQNILLVVNGLPDKEEIITSKIDVFPHELFRPVLNLLSRHTIYSPQDKTSKEYLSYKLSYALEPDIVVETYQLETETYDTVTVPAPTFSTLVSCEEISEFLP